MNLEEIKNLSYQEKLLLIDELLLSIDHSVIENYLNSEKNEADAILQERWKKYKSGKMRCSPVEDVINRLKYKSAERNKQYNKYPPY
jgi:putative addiction module component (TIGR02574 family)